jgi:glutathione S-transferase
MTTITLAGPIALSGAPGSPYTRKMVAVLRYRRLAYRLLPPEGPALSGLPAPKVRLLPTVYLAGASGDLEAVTDSTPIIRRLEAERPGRSVVPSDPALAFIDALIEDYADEWLTKAMFHYRWSYAADIAYAGRQLPLWRRLNMSDEDLARLSETISQRQIGRLGVVGSNPVTAPIIEASYLRLLDLLEDHLRGFPHLLGARPGTADFGIYGQLTQLVRFDPTPSAIAAARAPRVCAWADLMEDRSGLEPAADDWLDPAAPPPSLSALLTEIGRVYVPVMLANAAAVASGAPSVEAQVDGQTWTQSPFPYQAKCVGWLRAAHQALAPVDRARVDAILDGTGCEAMFRTA